MADTWTLQLDHIMKMPPTCAMLLGNEVVLGNFAWFEAEPLCASSTLVFVNCLLYGLFNRYSTKMVVVANLSRKSPILKVLTHDWMVLWQLCHFCILYW